MNSMSSLVVALLVTLQPASPSLPHGDRFEHRTKTLAGKSQGILSYEDGHTGGDESWPAPPRLMRRVHVQATPHVHDAHVSSAFIEEEDCTINCNGTQSSVDTFRQLRSVAYTNPALCLVHDENTNKVKLGDCEGVRGLPIGHWGEQPQGHIVRSSSDRCLAEQLGHDGLSHEIVMDHCGASGKIFDWKLVDMHLMYNDSSNLCAAVHKTAMTLVMQNCSFDVKHKFYWYPPRPCVWDNWMAWTECSQTCGVGTMSRKRLVFMTSEPMGRQCPGKDTEVVGCNIQPCPVDCEWHHWSAFTECSLTCGGGVRTRHRNLRVMAQNGGLECKGEPDYSELCNDKHCPRDCMWAEWEPFGECSKSCEIGEHFRRREMLSAAAFGGQACEGPNQEWQYCRKQPCPNDCRWTAWQQWSECTKPCNVGQRTRRREILMEADHGGLSCAVRHLKEVKACNVKACPVDCELSPWGHWGPCTQSCNGGTKSRSRVIGVYPANGGKHCGGFLVERNNCKEWACPVDCMWETWGEWEPCSLTCGEGITLRTRGILEAGSGGRLCEGSKRSNKTCSGQPCPIDCLMGAWQAWSLRCELYDGNCRRTRKRSPFRKPLFGGLQCIGSLVEQDPCLPYECQGTS